MKRTILAQILCSPKQGGRCANPSCRNVSAWKMRMFMDVDEAFAMQKRGIETAIINNTLWDQACAEQDDDNLRTYRISHLCNDHLWEMCAFHAGKNPTTLAAMTSLLTERSILLVSHRGTEQAGLIPGLPRTIRDEEVLSYLEDDNLYPIRTA